jgi:hypothetical protein
MLLFLLHSVMQVNKKDPGDEAWVFVLSWIIGLKSFPLQMN